MIDFPARLNAHCSLLTQRVAHPVVRACVHMLRRVIRIDGTRVGCIGRNGNTRLGRRILFLIIAGGQHE